MTSEQRARRAKTARHAPCISFIIRIVGAPRINSVSPHQRLHHRYSVGQGQILYSPTGNLKRDVSGHTFDYDGENRQVAYDGGASVAGGADYAYDGDGRRVKKVAGGSVVTTIFVYNAIGQMVAEYDNSGQQSTVGTSYLTMDTLGSPRIITDSSGLVKARHDYLPFGEEIGLVGGRTSQHGYVVDNVRQKFTGKERDVETGLDYFGARYYGSMMGRFTSADPLFIELKRLGDPQQLNIYVYTRNNPLRFVDPTGLDINVTGDAQEDYRKRLQQNTPSFQVAINESGMVRIVDAKGKELDKKELKKLGKSLTGGEKELFKAITDEKNHVTINTLSTQDSGVFFGRFDGKGTNALDFSDINLLDNPKNAGGFSAAQLVGHETLEAYKAAKTGATDPTNPHNYANKFFGGLEESTSSSPIFDANKQNLIGVTAVFPIHGRSGVSANVTMQLVTPIPIQAIPTIKPGSQLAHVTNVEKIP